MNSLPNADLLRIEKLTAVFGNTTNSYKYIWFWAILESVQQETISLNHLAVKRIFANFTLNYWKNLYFNTEFAQLFN